MLVKDKLHLNSTKNREIILMIDVKCLSNIFLILTFNVLLFLLYVSAIYMHFIYI